MPGDSVEDVVSQFNLSETSPLMACEKDNLDAINAGKHLTLKSGSLTY
jgi:hypothetical protein